MSEDLVIRLRDIRAAGFCTGRYGARSWFQRHGLDWSAFIRNGIRASELLATGDSMAVRVVEVARGR